MSTARAQVAAAITAGTTGWDVKPYPYTPANVSARRPVACVFRTDLEPAENGTLRHALTVNLYGSATVGEAAEDELDALLDQLMLALQALPGCVFDKAERSTFKDVMAGWAVTCHVHSTNIYKSTILKDGAP